MLVPLMEPFRLTVASGCSMLKLVLLLLLLLLLAARCVRCWCR